MLDKAAIEEVESQLQATDPDYQARHADAVHDLLLKLGDLTAEEIRARSANEVAASAVQELAASRRAVRVRIAGEARYIPAEYAARYRDGLGTPLPPGLADAFLEPVAHPRHELIRRYARTHGPFPSSEPAARFGLRAEDVEAVLKALHAAGKLLEGEFRPDGIHREWCDPDVLQQIRRKTLARLRREVEPAAQRAFARMLTRWQGVTTPRRGVDALLDAIELLQGAALLVSELEREILPARVAGYTPADLDVLLASGEVVWVGKEASGERDGRIALYLAESLARLRPPPAAPEADAAPLSERARAIEEYLGQMGASFFAALHQAAGGGYPGETVDALWELVWAGRITNDTFHPVRNLLRPARAERPRGTARDGPPGSPEFLRRLRARTGHSNAGEGRWSLVAQRAGGAVTATEWSAAAAQQLLVRYGIVMRETALAENVPGGYPAVYPALRTMEESGWIRRGMFVAGLGAAQFAMTAAVDMLRAMRADPERPEAVHLAASDPANPYGTLLGWPRAESESHSMARAAGASVILVNGELAAFLRRRNPAIRVFLPENEPERSRAARELARKLAEVAAKRQAVRSGLMVASINDEPARDHLLGRYLEEAGFVDTVYGFQMRRGLPVVGGLEPDPEDDSEEETEPETA